MTNPLSLYSSFLAFQAQHASSGHRTRTRSSSRHTRTSRMAYPRRTRSSHCRPHSSTMGIPQPPVTPQGWDRRRDRARDYASGHEVDSQQISLGLSSPRLLSRRQTTIRDRRGASPGPTPPKLQLYVPSEPTARALPTSTADQRRGRTSTSAAVVAGNQRFTWDVSEDHSPPAAVPRPTPKSVGSNL